MPLPPVDPVNATVGAVFGDVFARLSKAVEDAIIKTVMFKSNLQHLKSKIDSLKPLVEDIEKFYEILERKEAATKKLKKQLIEGKALVDKCLTIRWCNYIYRYYYAGKIEDLEKSIFDFFKDDLPALTWRDQAEILKVVRDIREHQNSSGETYAIPNPPAKENIVGMDMALKELKMELFKDERLTAPGRGTCAVPKPPAGIVRLDMVLKMDEVLIAPGRGTGAVPKPPAGIVRLDMDLKIDEVLIAPSRGTCAVPKPPTGIVRLDTALKMDEVLIAPGRGTCVVPKPPAGIVDMALKMDEVLTALAECGKTTLAKMLGPEIKGNFFEKFLTWTDIRQKLVIPTNALEHVPPFEGHVDFMVRNQKGQIVSSFRCYIRVGGYPKPVISGGWLQLVRSKEPHVGDKITFYPEEGHAIVTKGYNSN